MIENLTNFADSFKEISFLKDSISICVTQVEDKDLTVDNFKKSLENILNSPNINEKAKELLGYCLSSVSIFYAPDKEDLKNGVPIKNEHMFNDLTKDIKFLNIQEKREQDPNFIKMAINASSYEHANTKFKNSQTELFEQLKLVTDLIKAKLDSINDQTNIDFKIVQRKVEKMRKVEVSGQGNLFSSMNPFAEKHFEWIPYEEIRNERVPFYKEHLDLYSYCTLNVTCKSIFNSGNEFSYDKLKKSINGMFRVL